MADTRINSKEQNKEDVVSAVDGMLLDDATNAFGKCLADMAVRLHKIPGGDQSANEAVSICNSVAYLDTYGVLPKISIETNK